MERIPFLCTSERGTREMGTQRHKMLSRPARCLEYFAQGNALGGMGNALGSGSNALGVEPMRVIAC